MEEEGIIREVLEDYSLVEIVPSTSCKHCGASVICHPIENKRLLKVNNLINAKTGDKVKVSIEGKMFLKAAFVTYIFPLIILLISMLLSGKIAVLLELNNKIEIFQIGGAIVGLFFGLIIVKIINSYIEKDSKKSYRASVVKNINDS